MSAAKPTRLIGYVRVSTAEQHDSGLSIAVQAKQIRGYCELYGYELPIIYDEAGSGKGIEDRPVLKAILAEMKSGSCDGIVVAKLDRLTRSVSDFAMFVGDYFDKSQLHSVNERIDTTSAAGRMLVTILVTFSQYERELIVERTKAALNEKRSRGESVGVLPLGKRLASDGVHIEDDPTEMQAIAMARMWFAKSGNLRETARQLDEAGFKTRNGSKWHPEQVKRMLGYGS
jgi:DNA invertase Pin-like site-specific DNA recombinase